MFCLFSPDFEKHIDVDPFKRSWLVRNSKSGEVLFKIPNTFLALSGLSTEQIMTQARLIAWNTNNQINLIDVSADPFIQETIEIPNQPALQDPNQELSYEKIASIPNQHELQDPNQELSYEKIASMTVPYLDIEPYR